MISQTKTFFSIFSAFLNSKSNFEDLKKKNAYHISCVSKIAYSKKTWLDNSLKSPVSEDPSTSNIINGSKHC